MNKADLYEMAIIGGLLASGEHTLDSIKEEHVRFHIRVAADALVIDRVEVPAHACLKTVEAAIKCLTHFMSEPRTLARALEHLTQLGFTEDVARYAYSVMVEYGDLTLGVVGGVPVLAHNA